ncbi:SHOCT domain-containing protein [Halorarius halobius]|uniref:SHOCT domain-containing protein n=1 Tax=Halorarius halobius TaxID=2962671 RepID=UPI0020CC9099|nr:SHOCT domain-containing protein [Halorarius halobius]
MGVVENLREEATGVLTLLILGAGFLAMFGGYGWFWMVWVVGFAVVLPLVGIALGEGEESLDPFEDGTDHDGQRQEAEEDDPLEALKRRYAEGKLTDAEFEERLERLLETEDEQRAREYLDRRERERAEE